MSYYDSGATEVGRLITVATPSTIKQEIDSVDQYIHRLNRDVQTHKDKLADLIEDWHLFVEDWGAFQKNTGWFGRTSGFTLDMAQEFRARADAWDEIIRRRGATVTPSATAPTPTSKPTDLLGPILKFGTIAVAAYVGVNLVRAFRTSGQGA
jgi:hypothetical protein